MVPSIILVIQLTLTVNKASIELLSNIDDLATNMDGDPGPSMPVDIEVLPRVLKVFAPANTKEKGFEFAYTTTYLINCREIYRTKLYNNL